LEAIFQIDPTACRFGPTEYHGFREFRYGLFGFLGIDHTELWGFFGSTHFVPHLILLSFRHPVFRRTLMVADLVTRPFSVAYSPERTLIVWLLKISLDFLALI